MDQELPLDWHESFAGRNTRAAEKMIDHLRGAGKLTIEDESLATSFITLAETLDASNPRRAAAVALATAQFVNVWKELKALQVPAEATLEEFDVYLMPVLADAS